MRRGAQQRELKLGDCRWRVQLVLNSNDCRGVCTLIKMILGKV